MKGMMSKVRRFVQLDRGRQTLVVQALVLLPVVRLSLKLFELKRTQGTVILLLPNVGRSMPEDQRHAIVTTTTQEVARAVRHCQPWANCLKWSLVLWTLLRSQGIDSELRIGVRREAGQFQAHAWVEWENTVLNDVSYVREQYATFDRAIDAELLLGLN